MSRCQLVLYVASMFVHTETDIRYHSGEGELLVDCIKCFMADELSKRLVEPEIIPPVHSDEIAEPHMGNLVQEDMSSSADITVGIHPLWNECFRVSHGTRVLHRTVGEVRTEYAVEFVEWVQVVEETLVELQAIPLEFVDIVLFCLNVLAQALCNK
jgi:hypothetical protein